MLSLLATAALLLAPLATAVPAPGISDTTNIDAPNHICVYFCEDINFEGYCKQLCTSTAQCETLQAPLRGEVSAVGPAKDASGCTFYSGTTCDGDDLANVENPGLGDLTTNGWNDRIQSWICY